MPLSKARDKERKRLLKLRLENKEFQPNNEALQSKSSGIETLLNTTVSPPFQPNIADEVKRLYPDGKLPNCKDGRYRE